MESRLESYKLGVSLLVFLILLSTASALYRTKWGSHQVIIWVAVYHYVWPYWVQEYAYTCTCARTAYIFFYPVICCQFDYSYSRQGTTVFVYVFLCTVSSVPNFWYFYLLNLFFFVSSKRCLDLTIAAALPSISYDQYLSV